MPSPVGSRRAMASTAGGRSKPAAASSRAWDELAELGLCGLYRPGTGGLGMGAVEGMLVMEALGRGIVLEQVAQSFMAGAVLAAYPMKTRDDWLPRIAAVRRWWCWRTGNARHATGSTCATPRRRKAAHQLRLERQQSLVPAGDEGRRLHQAGPAGRADAPSSSSTCAFGTRRRRPRLRHAGCCARDGGLRQGSRDADRGRRPAGCLRIHEVDIGIAAACAEAIGVMDQTLAITVDYMNTRKQFDAIASFQAAAPPRGGHQGIPARNWRARLDYYASLKLGAPPAERRQAAARQVPARGVDALRRPAVGATARRHRRDGRIHRQPLFQLTQLEILATLPHPGRVSSASDTAGVFS